MNILITGVGGQGLVTLKKVLSYATIKEGSFFRASELHGLSQRGGSVSIHFRFGPSTSSGQDPSNSLRTGQINSPLILQNEADLIIGLDLLEATRAINFASSKTVFLVNNHFIPFFQLPTFTKEDFLKIVQPITKNIFIVEAAKICQEKLKSSVFEGIFLLGFGAEKKIIPFNKDSFIFGIKKTTPFKFTKANIKAFNLGKKYGQQYL